jgi:hypothetical protein
MLPDGSEELASPNGPVQVYSVMSMSSSSIHPGQSSHTGTAPVVSFHRKRSQESERGQELLGQEYDRRLRTRTPCAAMGKAKRPDVEWRTNCAEPFYGAHMPSVRSRPRRQWPAGVGRMIVGPGNRLR